MEAHVRLNNIPPGLLAHKSENLAFMEDYNNDQNPDPPLQSCLRLGHLDTVAIILSHPHQLLAPPHVNSYETVLELDLPTCSLRVILAADTIGLRLPHQSRQKVNSKRLASYR